MALPVFVGKKVLSGARIAGDEGDGANRDAHLQQFLSSNDWAYCVRSKVKLKVGKRPGSSQTCIAKVDMAIPTSPWLAEWVLVSTAKGVLRIWPDEHWDT
jgi:hypothetical protein